ncbi:alpha/beta hydrolase family protein [Nocardia concava]|uniref:alpha/beta hydrolase family protein n=1 Tax=Nocardia concava TaxID=257281 RepID=UPI0002EDB7DD|nr:alpha/beta fold hydrolase [Nocardia concava]
MSWKRRALIATSCVAALALSAGGWVIAQNDFAIREERVTITGGVQPLQGVLALPEHGEKPFGLVVFVHGDGAADATRDSFYRPLWESFARAGYASLAWDKPGVDGAPGNWLDQSMHDRAVETEAAIAWARGRPEIDGNRIGVWGISQAGWVLPEVAARHPELRFMILAGPAINWLRQGEYNLRAELAERHAAPQEVEAELRRRESTLSLLREGADYARYRGATTDSPPMSEDRWRFASRNYLADVTETLPGLRVPTLLLLGEHDLNVDVAETERVYRALVPAGLLTVRTFPDASHNLVKFDLDKPDSVRSFLVALFAPRSLYAPGYLDTLRRYAADLEMTGDTP